VKVGSCGEEGEGQLGQGREKSGKVGRACRSDNNKAERVRRLSLQACASGGGRLIERRRVGK